MKYVKAHDVLPEEIIKIIQEYVDGEYLYVPRKNENHRSWGEKSGIKNSLKVRNKEIYKKYIDGATINELTQKYYLSEKSIKRIIVQEKRLCSQSLQNYLLD
jgi:Mor family transcriptional regulator